MLVPNFLSWFKGPEEAVIRGRLIRKADSTGKGRYLGSELILECYDFGVSSGEGKDRNLYAALQEGAYVEMSLVPRKKHGHPRIKSIRSLTPEETEEFLDRRNAFLESLTEGERTSNRNYAMSWLRGHVGEEITVEYAISEPKKEKAILYYPPHESGLCLGTGQKNHWIHWPVHSKENYGIRLIRDHVGSVIYRNLNSPRASYGVYVFSDDGEVRVAIVNSKAGNEILEFLNDDARTQDIWALPTLQELEVCKRELEKAGVIGDIKAIVSTAKGEHEVREPQKELSKNERHAGWLGTFEANGNPNSVVSALLNHLE